MSSASWQDRPALIAFLVTLLWFVAPDLARAATVEEVALAKTANRQTLLEEGAKKEGKLLWYTTLSSTRGSSRSRKPSKRNIPTSRSISPRRSEALVQRMLAEYQVKGYDVDVLDGTSTIVMLKRSNYIQRFVMPQLRHYPASRGTEGFWAVPNLYFMTLGHNTKPSLLTKYRSR